MPLRRASLLMPCSRLEDLPTRLRGAEAADLLSAWTALWHPALIHATGALPGWHSTDEPPEPETLDGELVLVPSVSRERLSVDWRERVAAANPHSPPPLNSVASRGETVAAVLHAAALSPERLSPAIANDFLALGYAHLQVELLTRAMRYTSVLDANEFRAAVIDAAQAAIGGDDERAHGDLARAFDMLTDARNHFYGVDFYLIDVTLLAGTTIGEPLRQKLETGQATNLLGSAAVIEQMAREHPESLAALIKARQANQAGVLLGPCSGSTLDQRAPEEMLAELLAAKNVYRQLLNCDPEIYGQFGAAYSPLLPEVLKGLGLQAALVSAFDGNRCERPTQIKSRWGETGGATIDVLAALPLDIAEPGTWLAFGERIADTLARDHVATLLLAGWPGQACEYYDDLRRIAAYGPVLGKFVTLDEYFRSTAEADDWATFRPQMYPLRTPTVGSSENPISSKVDAYRQQAFETFDRLSAGLAAIVTPGKASERNADRAANPIVLNPWNFGGPRYVGIDPLNGGQTISQTEIRNPKSEIAYLPEVPGCGFATLAKQTTDTSVSLVDGRTLRNEHLEVVVSEATGGIQSLRSHRDRNTRVSQRLVMHDRRLPRGSNAAQSENDVHLDVRMLADRVEIARNDALVGEIISQGQLLDADNGRLACFKQTLRLVRGLPAVIVNIELDIERTPEGDVWNSYFASRLAWREEAVSLRHGVDWTARATGRSRIDSSEWVEISDAVGSITCFGLGLPFHRLAGPTWLDTLLSAAGETTNRFQFAIGLNCRQPNQTALALLTAARPSITNWPIPPTAPSGWFFHVSAKHVIVTHLEPLPAPQTGVRLRLLETEGRTGGASFTAFRPLQRAQRTDFRGTPIETLAVADGRVQFEIAPYGWLQIEAEW